ncbi:MAG: hypothetical protein IJT03_02360 [Clostridia bacterium]|nr:hypothetical protein [Clostridia bacterium]
MIDIEAEVGMLLLSLKLADYAASGGDTAAERFELFREIVKTVRNFGKRGKKNE